MADTPVDISGPRKSVEKNADLKTALQNLFILVSDAHTKLHMRMEDLVKDSADLSAEVNEVIASIYSKYPELEPEEIAEVEE